MLAPGHPESHVRFGEFDLDLAAGELRRRGIRVSIPEQPLRLLQVLVEHPGVTVSREQLRERLWSADTFVDFEHGLNAAVKRLRDALGDSTDQPQFIETVPKRGYRFIATVEIPATAVTGPYPGRLPRRLGVALVAAVAVGVVALAARWSSIGQTQATPAPAARTETRLTFGGGLQTEPSWSPDGRMIVYSAENAGSRDLWVQSITGGEPLQLTKTPALEWEPSWSSDGTIAFRVEGDEGGIYTMHALGGPAQRLTAFGVRPKWSPDSRHLLFGSTNAILGVSQALFLVRRDGRPPIRILERETVGLDDLSSWTWHPDSQRVSFIASRAGESSRIYTVSISGGPLIETPLPAAVGNEIEFPLEVTWVGGHSMIISGLRRDGTSSMWRISVDPKSLRTQQADPLRSGGTSLEAPAPAPTGAHVAYSRPAESNRLWRLSLDSRMTRVTGTGTALTEDGAWVNTSDLSPDGRAVVYSLMFAGSDRSELRIMELETGQSRTLARDGNSRVSVHWSRDGRNLAYMMAVPTGGTASETAIAVRRLDISEDRIITTPRTFSRAFHEFIAPSDFSPEGDAVLAASDYFSPHFSLALFPVAAAPAAERAARIVVSDSGYNVWQGNYSPNGKWLAFAAQARAERGKTTIEVVSGSGGDSRTWIHVTRTGQADKPRWSPDGKRLFFISERRGFYNVWAVPFDPDAGRVAGEALQITHFESQSHMMSKSLGFQEPSVSRNFLILLMTEKTGSIWMLDGVDR